MIGDIYFYIMFVHSFVLECHTHTHIHTYIELAVVRLQIDFYEGNKKEIKCGKYNHQHNNISYKKNM